MEATLMKTKAMLCGLKLRGMTRLKVLLIILYLRELKARKILSAEGLRGIEVRSEVTLDILGLKGRSEGVLLIMALVMVRLGILIQS